MTIKVGIIENEEVFSTHLINLLNEWSQMQNCDIYFDLFLSGEQILSQTTIDYNILFVDIQLLKINGVETAKKLRKKNYTGEIVFLTVFNEYVFEGYNVHALNYILKPITADKLNSCMNIVLQLIQSKNYILSNRDTIEKIPYQQILYILSARHYMEIFTPDRTYRHLISIKNIMKHLPSQFIQCHRTVIINIKHVQKLEGHSIAMSNKVVLPVSNTYLQTVRRALENLVF